MSGFIPPPKLATSDVIDILSMLSTPKKLSAAVNQFAAAQKSYEDALARYNDVLEIAKTITGAQKYADEVKDGAQKMALQTQERLSKRAAQLEAEAQSLKRREGALAQLNEERAQNDAVQNRVIADRARQLDDRTRIVVQRETRNDKERQRLATLKAQLDAREARIKAAIS